MDSPYVVKLENTQLQQVKLVIPYDEIEVGPHHKVYKLTEILDGLVKLSRNFTEDEPTVDPEVEEITSEEFSKRYNDNTLIPGKPYKIKGSSVNNVSFS